jgi:hypothetical protein
VLEEPAAHLATQPRAGYAPAMRSVTLATLCLLALSCGKATCPTGDLECLWSSLKVADSATAPDGPWEKLFTVDEAKLSARASAAGADAGVSLTANEAMNHESAEDFAILAALWTDQARCRPSLCMSACPSRLRCVGPTRCTPARSDGISHAATTHWVEYDKAPRSNTSFEMRVIAASAPGCPADITSLLDADSPALLVSRPAWVKVTIPGKDGDGGGGGTCTGGFIGSTRLAVPDGRGGCTQSGAADQCLTRSDFESAGVAYPGQCSAQGTPGCYSGGTVVKPCCGTLRCVVATVCGGDATLGGQCLP